MSEKVTDKESKEEKKYNSESDSENESETDNTDSDNQSESNTDNTDNDNDSDNTDTDNDNDSDNGNDNNTDNNTDTDTDNDNGNDTDTDTDNDESDNDSSDNKKSKVKKNNKKSKTTKKRKFSTRKSKYKKEPDVYSVYILKPIIPNIKTKTKTKTGRKKRIATYTGSTQNFGKRIAQHNGIISRGAKTTKRISYGNKYPVVPICVLSGPMTKTESLSLEKKIKVATLSLAKGTPMENIKYKADGTLIHHRVRKLLIILCLERWTQKCRKAKDIPVTLRWFLPDEAPDKDYGSYLPSYVKEVNAHDQLTEYVPKLLIIK